jgi:hypothetical protein
MPIKRLKYETAGYPPTANVAPCPYHQGVMIHSATCTACEFHLSSDVASQVVRCTAPTEFDVPKAIRGIEDCINSDTREDIEADMKKVYLRYAKLEYEEYVQLDESVGRDHGA